MKIESVELWPVELTFSTAFPHSLRNRSAVRNVVVRVRTADSTITGYGEGAPRSYVTGESQESVGRALRMWVALSDFPWNIDSMSQISRFVDGLEPGAEHNAALCALETALLDAWARHRRKSLIDLFPDDFRTDRITYGAALPLGTRENTEQMSRMIKHSDIGRLKLKMGLDLERNATALAAIADVFGTGYDLKVDVNGVWDLRTASAHIPLLKQYQVRVLEQPMAANDPDLPDLARQLEAVGIVLMADESACCMADLERIVQNRCYRMINMRLSKCGGFHRSLQMIEFLRSERIDFQVACHLGESGLLSAAGRTLSLLCRDAVYYDGSYDAFLLNENVTKEDVSFAAGGYAGPLGGHGLGVTVSRRKLKALSRTAGILRFEVPYRRASSN